MHNHEIIQDDWGMLLSSERTSWALRHAHGLGVNDRCLIDLIIRAASVDDSHLLIFDHRMPVQRRAGGI